LVLCVFFSLGGLLHAQSSAISNLDQPAGSNIAVGKTPEFNFSTGFSFTTGSVNTTLAGITLSMFTASSESAAGFSVAIYNGIGTTGPTGLFGTLSGSTTPVTTGLYSYTTPGLSLLADTTYWIVATAPTTPTNTHFRILSTTSTAEDAGGFVGWSIGDSRWLTNNGGASWFNTTTGQLPFFSVQLMSVPEPSTFALLATGVLVAAWFRRRS
jgi:hypothetical protein